MTRINYANLGAVAKAEQERVGKYKAMLMVCAGTGCVSAKAFPLIDSLKAQLTERGLDKDFLVVATGCNGFCGQGPIMVVQPEGVFYQKLKEQDVTRVIEEHLVGGKPVQELMYAEIQGLH